MIISLLLFPSAHASPQFTRKQREARADARRAQEKGKSPQFVPSAPASLLFTLVDPVDLASAVTLRHVCEQVFAFLTNYENVSTSIWHTHAAFTKTNISNTTL